MPNTGYGKDTVTGSGTNSQGNHYCNRASDTGSTGYHYSNTSPNPYFSDGSYYYNNTNGSTYYNSGTGYAQYTPPSGQQSKSNSK